MDQRVHGPASPARWQRYSTIQTTTAPTSHPPNARQCSPGWKQSWTSGGTMAEIPLSNDASMTSMRLITVMKFCVDKDVELIFG